MPFEEVRLQTADEVEIQAWFIPGLPLPHKLLIWIAGMIIVAAAIAASGLALNDDPVSGRRALYRFAIGHVLVGLIVWIEWPPYWRDQGLPLWVALAPLIIGIGLLVVAFVAPPAGFSLALMLMAFTCNPWTRYSV